MHRRTALLLSATTAVAVAVPAVTATSVAAGEARQVASRHSTHAAQQRTTYFAITGGATTLKLNAKTANALTSNGYSLAPVSEAKASQAGVSFPIEGGLLTARTLAGRITHDGGLTLSKGGTSLTIRDFTIDTRAATLTAWADEAGARIPTLDLHLGRAKVAATRRHITVTGVRATLTGTAATALNSYFSTTLFTKGLPLGTATVSANGRTVRG